MQADFPEKLGILFQPAPYKVVHGGRGSGKSWGFARALLLLGRARKIRVLCAREVQKSIKQSVHKLLSDQIQSLGLGGFYQVLETEIRGSNGTEFSFTGLATHTADTIKSFEGCDYCWVEEGQAVSNASWNILRPTIRKPGSEIWISFNPELETDATYQMFVVDPPTGAIVVQMNYLDNPWFNEKLEQERLDCLSKQPKDYPNIWEGKCLPAVAGAIYFDEVSQADSDGRIGRFPYDPKLKVHRIWDMGWNDCMAIILAQRNASAITIVGYVTGTRRTTADYIAEFKGDKYRGWNWGSDYLPHDGFANSRQTGKADADILIGLGCEVKQTPNMAVETGIRQARLLFPRVYIDKVACASVDSALPGLVECMKRYRRKINQQTGTAGDPLHDVYSNGADAFRYLAVNAEQLSNEDWGKMAPLPDQQADSDGFYF